LSRLPFGQTSRGAPRHNQVSTKINDMLSKTSTSGALDAFNRMEDKIEKMEAEAEASARSRSCGSREYRLREYPDIIDCKIQTDK
jgi:phage shock protein A